MASYRTSNICEISIQLLSFHRAMSARSDNRAIGISQIFDVQVEAAQADFFSVISPDKSRSLWSMLYTFNQLWVERLMKQPR